MEFPGFSRHSQLIKDTAFRTPSVHIRHYGSGASSVLANSPHTKYDMHTIFGMLSEKGRN